MVKPHHRDQPFSRITLLLNPGYDPSMRQFGGHMRGHLVLGMLFTMCHCKGRVPSGKTWPSWRAISIYCILFI